MLFSRQTPESQQIPMMTGVIMNPDNVLGCNKAYACSDGWINVRLNGAAWTSQAINGWSSLHDSMDICIPDSLVVICYIGDGGGIYYGLKAAVDIGGTIWVNLNTDLNDNPLNKDCYSVTGLGTFAFIAAADGYVFRFDENTEEIETIESGSVTTSDLLAIHAKGDIVLAGARNGDIIYSSDGGVTFGAASSPTALEIRGCWIINDNVWYIATGLPARLYKTINQGAGWTQINFPLSGTQDSFLSDVTFSDSNSNVGYITYNHFFFRDDYNGQPVYKNEGRVFYTNDGSITWNSVQSEDEFPDNRVLLAVSICKNDDYHIVAVGGVTDIVIKSGLYQGLPYPY